MPELISHPIRRRGLKTRARFLRELILEKIDAPQLGRAREENNEGWDRLVRQPVVEKVECCRFGQAG